MTGGHSTPQMLWTLLLVVQWSARAIMRATGMALQGRGVMVDMMAHETSLATRYHLPKRLDHHWQRTACRTSRTIKRIVCPHQGEVATDQHEAEEAIHPVEVMVQEGATADRGVLPSGAALDEEDTMVKGVEGTVLVVEEALAWVV
jgi:hypothetical protein